MEFLVFQSVHIASQIVTSYCQEELCLPLLYSSCEAFIHIDNISPKPSLLGADQLLYERHSSALTIFVDHHWTCSSKSMSFCTLNFLMVR